MGGISVTQRTFLANRAKALPDLMEAKSNHLRGKFRQNVPTNPELAARKRLHEAAKELRALTGSDPW